MDRMKDLVVNSENTLYHRGIFMDMMVIASKLSRLMSLGFSPNRATNEIIRQIERNAGKKIYLICRTRRIFGLSRLSR